MKDYMQKAVRQAIAHLDSGTVGIGEDCLWQLTVKYIKDGPQGTNCAWVARQDFNEVVRSKPYAKFVYQQLQAGDGCTALVTA